jgi:hypothetical protein
MARRDIEDFALLLGVTITLGLGGIYYLMMMKKQDPEYEYDLEDTVRPTINNNMILSIFPTAVTPPPSSKPSVAAAPSSVPAAGSLAPSWATTGPILYDSNKDGGWNNGTARRVQGKEGSQSPNGKGFYTAASGKPRFIIDGKGVGKLEADGGHGRIYVQATNYNSSLSGELKFDTASLDNTTWKLRNRHDQGGACENRFGGVGGHLEKTTCGVKIEKCHNTHEKGTDKPLPKPIPVGQWIGFRFTVCDTPDKKGIRQTIEVDYKDGKGFVTTLDTTFTNPPAYYMDEATFTKDSNFWLRINNTATASASYRNVRLVKVSPKGGGTTSTASVRRLMIDEPYLFNGYYGRRRL